MGEILVGSWTQGGTFDLSKALAAFNALMMSSKAMVVEAKYAKSKRDTLSTYTITEVIFPWVGYILRSAKEEAKTII